MKFTADFETITNPEDCRVWAWAACNIDNIEEKHYGNDIESFLEWCSNKSDTSIYFHNLKFDGQFIISYLI